MNSKHSYFIQFTKNFNISALQSAVNFAKVFAQSQKTTASREKLNYLHQANDSRLLTVLFLFVTFAHLKAMRILFSI